MALPPTAAGEPAAPMMPPAEPMTEGGGWVVCCTILENKETGEFKLTEGDEPEMDPGAAEGPTFASGAEMMRALMQKIENPKGADDAFASGYKGGEGAGPAPMPGGPME